MSASGVGAQSAAETVVDVQVATVRSPLPEPIRFGDWVMKHREFALVRVLGSSGRAGFAFTLTREGPVAAAVAQAVRHQYVGESVLEPADATRLFDRCQASNVATLSSGTGLRALSIVDLALHDLLARSAGLSVARYLGREPRPLPATAIIGYPPAAMDAAAVQEQVRQLSAAGWRRFKIPIALPFEYGRERVLAAREAAGADAWIGLDAAWVFRSVDEALTFLRSVADAELGWFEDVFPPGDAGIVAALRKQAGGTAIAMGDDQGGSYYPEALLMQRAVDVVRLDLTCMGGISRAPALLELCDRAGVACSPHMFAHVHSQVFAGYGRDVPIEWGVPGTGVDQFADSLMQPTIVDGRMQPLHDEPGFGTLVNAAWLAEQEVDDPSGLVGSLDG